MSIILGVVHPCLDSCRSHSEQPTYLNVLSFIFAPFFCSCFQIGLQGEHLGVFKESGASTVNWVATSTPTKNKPLTWYKVKVFKRLVSTVSN